MTNSQRIKNDIATGDKREIADKVTRENRIRNDELTIERRDRADITLENNRVRNDITTANRRDIKDENIGTTAVAISLGVLLVLAIGMIFIFA